VTVLAQHGDAVAVSRGDVAVQQLGHAVQARRILERGQVEHEVRPQVGGREVVPREGVDVGRRT
jgi:hypothetical protein